MIEVLRGGDRVPGSMVLSADDMGLIFTPTESWTGSEYHLRVLPTLEDLAGNNLRGAFDRGEKQTQEVAVPVEVLFLARSADR
jgi:hypothetical protein